MSELSIREFGYIIQKATNQEINNDEPSSSLDVCAVNPEAWKYLEDYAYNSDKENRFIRPRSYNGKEALQVVNFVGVLSLPGDIHLEILPKTSKDGQDNIEVRKLLVKMLSEVYELPFMEHTKANIQVFKRPLLEVLITWFLQDLANVVRKGIRKDYERIEAEEKFLKGRLLVSQQINQPVSRRHLFHIAYDIFSENRAENRLIHSALVQVAKWSKDENNQKLARELRFAFNEIPKSTDYKTDFGQWRNSRDMISYKPLLYWVKLILNQQSPFSIKGDSKGISFLFPMETLFEKYVANILEKKAQKDYSSYKVEKQVNTKYLAKKPEDDSRVFQLKPDLAIYERNLSLKTPICILDTKWKLIDQDAKYDNGNEDKKSKISQSDMYQMFAYGHKYLKEGKGKLVLIYPKCQSFEKQMHFDLDNGLILDVFPFDLDDADASVKILLSKSVKQF